MYASTASATTTGTGATSAAATNATCVRSGVSPSRLGRSQMRPTVSVITACMNRNENLSAVINSWIPVADEIVICDWSSKVRVVDTLWELLTAQDGAGGQECPESNASATKIRIVEIVGQPRWRLSPAFNVA